MNTIEQLRPARAEGATGVAEQLCDGGNASPLWGDPRRQRRDLERVLHAVDDLVDVKRCFGSMWQTSIPNHAAADIAVIMMSSAIIWTLLYFVMDLDGLDWHPIFPAELHSFRWRLAVSFCYWLPGPTSPGSTSRGWPSVTLAF
jgi:hypothetical protein